MTMFDGNSEAEWMAETIIDDFARSLNPAEKIQFYSRLVELLSERICQIQQVLEAGDPDPDPNPDPRQPVH